MKEVALLLDRKPRSAESWCNRKGLPVQTDDRDKFVVTWHFVNARFGGFIQSLKAQYGEPAWTEVFQAYMENDLLRLLALETATSTPPTTQPNRDVIRMSHVEPGLSTCPNGWVRYDYDAMDDKPLHIPKNQRFKGVRVYCNECKTLVYDSCKLTGKPIAKCKFGNRHRYKIIKYKKGSDARETLTLQTRDYAEVIRIATEFFRQSEPRRIAVPPQSSAPAPVASISLTDAAEQYYAYLENVGVPPHRKRSRSKDHVTDIRHSVRLLTDCLESNRLDPNRLPVTAITDDVVGLFHTYLTDTKAYSNRTYNKVFSHLTTFVSWYGKHHGPVENWFEKARRKRVQREAIAITPAEALRLFESVTPEGGIERVAAGKKHVRNYFYPWAVAGWKLMALTGRRREEVVSMRFHDIGKTDDGSYYIKSEDIKVNRIQGRGADEAKKHILVPMIKELKDLLYNELEWERRRNSGDYILAPDETMDRKLMAELLTRSFSHYYSKLNTGKTLTLKSLRKLYISSLAKLLRGSPKKISGHSGDQVLEHYIDPKVFLSVADGLTVLADPNVRETELDRARSHHNDLPNQTLER
ncbi:MAG TPA: site-specific integrase [Chitinophagales bacterium]|nr:site-specific integrase [Chitinophagales bacterium]